MSDGGKMKEFLPDGSQFFYEMGDAENESASQKLEALRSGEVRK